MMAAPRKKLPDRTVVGLLPGFESTLHKLLLSPLPALSVMMGEKHVYCSNCRTCLYRYAKGGTGSLVKCYHERILEDYTKGDLKCPQCQTEFARPAL